MFLGQIMPTAFAFAPRGFAMCNGQMLPISQNQALFSLLGTQYGGDGRSTFALPDLRGRTPTGAGLSADPSWQPPASSPGDMGGAESVALTPSSLPPHDHQLQGTAADGTVRRPTNALYGKNASNLYAPASGNRVPLDATTVAASGDSAPHENMQPFQVVNFCIALSGIFPSRQ